MIQNTFFTFWVPTPFSSTVKKNWLKKYQFILFKCLVTRMTKFEVSSTKLYLIIYLPKYPRTNMLCYIKMLKIFLKLFLGTNLHLCSKLIDNHLN